MTGQSGFQADRLIEAALAPGGVYAGWFTLSDMSQEGVETLLATLSDRFEHCNLAILRAGYSFTSCSDQPLQVRDPEERPLTEPLRKALRHRLYGLTPEEWLRGIFVSDDIFAAMELQEVPRNRDDFPILEFLIMRQAHGAGQPVRQDPISSDPARWSLRIGRGPGREGLLEQALVLKQLYPELYRRVYAEAVESDERLTRRFERRLTRARR